MENAYGYEIYGTPAIPPKEAIRYDPKAGSWDRMESSNAEPIMSLTEALQAAKDALDDDIESVRVLSYGDTGLSLIIAEFRH